jgi:signal transduction histidine kinase/ActR/RegA family two-component response regulator
LRYNLNSILQAKLKDLKELQLNPFTLTFRGANKSFEQEFIDFYFDEKVFQIRAAILIGVTLYSLFGILDAVLMDNLKYTFWFIRFGIVLPFAVVTFVLTYLLFFEKLNQLLIMINNMVGGIGIVVMVVLAGPPVSYSYYAGLMLVFIFVYTFSGLRFLWANATCWSIVIIFEVIAVFFKDIPLTILISNTFFFVSANILSMFAAYFIEYSLRRNFYLTKMLEIEKEKVSHAKKNLQRLVDEQTIQLSEANEYLKEELNKKRNLLREQKNLQEQLVQARKMEGIGLLAGGIAHDFNNILSGILGYSELADMSIENPEKIRGHISHIKKGVVRAAELTQQILTFSRPTENKKQLLQISIVVKEALKLLRSSIPTTIEIHENIFPNTIVSADPTQVHQVIMNLCTNAYHSMRVSGGVLKVELKEIEIVDQNTIPDLNILPGKYLKLSVSDTGHGMDKKIVSKIFDPYFTTKSVGEGSGLGLALVYGIIEGHDGFVQVHSTLGKGSVFHVFLPVTKEQPILNNRESHVKPLIKGIERVMVVDDEPFILTSTMDLLQDYGYKVSAFLNGALAYEEVKKNPYQFDLIITDMTMPKMTGYELSERVLKIRKNLPIFLCTGYSENVSEDKALKLGIKKFISKPIDSHDLLLLIREVLDMDKRD